MDHSCLPPLSGEIFELKAELNSDKKEKKKEAVKKVIASMTVGKDVRCAGGGSAAAGSSSDLSFRGSLGTHVSPHPAPSMHLLSGQKALCAVLVGSGSNGGVKWTRGKGNAR